MDIFKYLRTRFGSKQSVEEGHLSKSKVFCMAPWVQLHAQTDGRMSPCCISDVAKGDEIGNLRVDSDLRNAWNSEKMKQLRLNMCSGQKSNICTICYDYEQHGKKSERMQYNEDFKRYYNRVAKMLADGTVTDYEVPILDIRFSNKCNYKCRICNSKFSSLWYEEELKLGQHTSGMPKEMRAIHDEAVFWESFKSLLPFVERFHFAGGEPLFMDEHYEILEYLISIGRTDINITYNTNLSTLRYKKYNVVDLWNKFRKIDVWASLDDMGDKGDYQRKGQKWKEIEENIRTLQTECTSVIFGVNVTVSIFNILSIPQFYRYMVENKLVDADRMNLYLLFGPSQFSITNLAPSIKEKVIQQFDALEADYLSTLPDASRIREHIQSVISYMLSADAKEQDFLIQTLNDVDKIRNEDFSLTFPDLAEIVKS
jgi:MoaA/NifB/PqqE/SkfB family radical SAM enzyme